MIFFLLALELYISWLFITTNARAKKKLIVPVISESEIEACQ